MERPEDRRPDPDPPGQVRLSQWADVRVKKFSKGMTQRLGLACALIHAPKVLLLDEPTDGVDPVGRREIRDLLREQAGRGRAVLLNSHLLSEIELTCDRVAVLRHGKVAAFGSVEELTRGTTPPTRWWPPVDEGLVSAFRGERRRRGAGQRTHRPFGADVEHLNALVDQVRSRGGCSSELSPVRSTLEDIFVDLIRAEETAP